MPSQTCFVRLPPVLIRQLPPTTTACAFRLRWPAEAPNRTVYVSWGGEVSASDALEVPSALAEALGRIVEAPHGELATRRSFEASKAVPRARMPRPRPRMRCSMAMGSSGARQHVR